MTDQSMTGGSQTGLRVEVVDTITAFNDLRPAWDALQAQDPESTVFLSWEWLAKAFADNPFRWSVLVAWSGEVPDRALCILPLKYRVHWSRSRREFQTQLEAGGRLLWSEYTGFLCHPSFEAQGLQAIADKLRLLPWVNLSLRYVAQPRRAEVFANAMKARGAAVRFRDYMINGGETNNLLCPQVTLPADFDTYLAKQVSANRRQKFRRFQRKRLQSGELQITIADEASLTKDLDDLFDLWMQKWGPEKGEESARKVARNFRDVLEAAHDLDKLYLPVLRQGEQMLGALGHVVDPTREAVHFIVAGRDVSVSDEFLGAALHFHAIQWAIDHGYEVYDFCHGDEPYKFSFGAEAREVAYLDVRRRSDNPELTFDSIGTGAALRRIEEFIRTGKTERAARACAQLADLLD